MSGRSNFVRLEAREPEVLTKMGREAVANGTDRLSSRQIDEIIKAVRAKKAKR